MLQIQKTYVQGVPCHYLVQTYKLHGKQRQRVLLCLGEHSSIEAALEHWRAIEEDPRNAAGRKQAREFIRKLRHYLSSDTGNEPPDAGNDPPH